MEVIECKSNLRFTLNSCPSQELTAPKSCVSVYIGGIAGEPDGSGDYFDAAGTRYTLIVDTFEFTFETAASDTLQSGVIGGTLADGDAGVTPFSLTFSGCFRGPYTCPI